MPAAACSHVGRCGAGLESFSIAWKVEMPSGASILFGRSAGSCRRCHKMLSSGGEVGPDLSKIGKEKDRSYLLEAIVDPGAKVAKGFDNFLTSVAGG